jgi:hypothetical protein
MKEAYGMQSKRWTDYGVRLSSPLRRGEAPSLARRSETEKEESAVHPLRGRGADYRLFVEGVLGSHVSV